MSEISRKQIACILAVLMVCSVLLTSGNARASNDINEMTKSISHYAAGLMFDWYGLTDDAIEEYKQASEFDRDSYIIHLRLGANYIRYEE